MNKKVANIISAFIPCKTARKKCRAILTYGFIRSIRSTILLRKLRHKKIQPHYYLTVCAIAKNEGAYFQEWIEWHKNLGVEKFYIYDNETIYRAERMVTMTYEMTMPLLTNVKQWQVDSFDGSRYREGFRHNAYIFRFTFTINNRQFQFITGRPLAVS